MPQPLTPNEIRQRKLPRSLRGYREAETRQLIEEAAAAYEAALADLARALESVSRRERDLEAAQKALATAERAAEKMVVEAKQETAAILAEARATADKMTAEAQAVRDELAPERESMVEQAQAEAALIRRAAEQQVEALRDGAGAPALLDRGNSLAVRRARGGGASAARAAARRPDRAG